MKTLSCTVRLLTPAFLGDAEQNARWRTPPFKALLRQWWRVAYAKEHGFDVNVAEMRHTEGLLFGHAWPENDRDEHDKRISARRSAIRIRLELSEPAAGNAWTAGSQQSVAPLPTDLATSYAWFGLVESKSKNALRNAIAAHGPEAQRWLKIACPNGVEWPRLKTALRLMARFGQLGARSRGGWGSLHIDDIEPMSDTELISHARSLEDCLDSDWPMSLGRDRDGLLLWRSQDSFETWDQAMNRIARGRRAVRVALKGLNGKDLRPVLGFATKDGRMPSPLRWRVSSRGGGQLEIEVFAMPSLIPSETGQQISPDETLVAWQSVASTLDQSSAFVRSDVNRGTEG